MIGDPFGRMFTVLFRAQKKREQEIVELLETTHLSKKAIVAGMQLATELAACTTVSSALAWNIVKRFLAVFAYVQLQHVRTGGCCGFGIRIEPY